MFASHQLPMPTEYGVGLHQRRELKETFPADGLTFDGETPPLIVRQWEAPSSDDLAVRLDLFAKKVDRLVVTLVEPASESRNQERQGRNDVIHAGILLEEPRRDPVDRPRRKC